MHYTIEALINGEEVSQWYRAAMMHWQEALSGVDATDVNAIADIADREQSWFEHNCGSRFIGQEVMVNAGIGQYYQTSDGFGERIDKAKAMYEGLSKSMCSVEIHGHARRMAENYDELLEE